MFKKKFFAVFCLLLGLLFVFAACGQPKPDDSDKDKDKDPAPQTPVTPSEPTAQFGVSFRSGYTPERFDKDVKYETTELGEGVLLVANTVVKKDGKTSVVWTVEVDLEKAGIVAGTKGNVAEGFSYTKAVPYQTALDWEKATGGHVYTSLNADFFGAYCVNAFVKDGIIVKDSHNDNKNYDYKNEASDVPASAPMLFGVSGTKAQIAPIIQVKGDPETVAVKEKFVKAKLSYALNGMDVQLNVKEFSDDYITLLTTGTSSRQRTGYAVKVDLTKGLGELKVLEVIPIEKTTQQTAGEGYGYLMASDNGFSKCAAYLSELKEGDTVSVVVTSPDGTWEGYDTILGCRQALVTGGKIASTVTKENTNGAQSVDIPRSAVGIKNDHTVVIFAVESLYYYGKNVQEGDTHGMSLPELAEFAYYYGCSEAANFDGGGSTQLVVKGDTDEVARTVVRSADTGTSGLLDTRPVMNSILVVKR